MLPLAITSLVGAASSYRSANKAISSAERSGQAELGFAMEQYEDWKNVFGDIQSNLSDFYTRLTPSMLATQQLEGFEQEYNTALTSVRENLAQRGLVQSGLAVESEGNMATQRAQIRSQIRAEAPLKVAQEQQNFLALGMNSNPANNVQGVLSNRASNDRNTAFMASQQAGKAIGQAVETGLDWFSSQSPLDNTLETQ